MCSQKDSLWRSSSTSETVSLSRMATSRLRGGGVSGSTSPTARACPSLSSCPRPVLSPRTPLANGLRRACPAARTRTLGHPGAHSSTTVSVCSACVCSWPKAIVLYKCTLHTINECCPVDHSFLHGIRLLFDPRKSFCFPFRSSAAHHGFSSSL